MKIFITLLLCFLAAAPGNVFADTLTVAADGSKMYSTVSAALNDAANGDVIDVYGIIPQDQNNNWDGIYVTKNVTIQGHGIQNTIFQGGMADGHNATIISIYANVTLKNIRIDNATLFGVAVGFTGNLNIEKCEISNCYRGVISQGIITMSDCSIHDCTYSSGEALWIYPGAVTSSYIRNSCIYNNTGAGIVISAVDPDAVAYITNSTISGNTGGGVHITNSNLYLDNCTISNNSNAVVAGGLWIYDPHDGLDPKAYIKNTIIAGNTTGFLFPDLFLNLGTLVSLGNNLIGNVEFSNFSTNTAGDRYGDPNGTTTPNAGAIESATAIDPMLSPLGDYGGLTFTHALLPGSPAIDNGADTYSDGNPVTIDQRHFKRSITNTNVDIGAYEYSTGIPSLSGWAAILFGGVLLGFGIRKLYYL